MHRRRIVAFYAALVVASVAALLFLVPEKSDFKSSALFARDTYSRESHVDLEAYIDQNLISKGDNVKLEINIRNSNLEPITDLHASIAAPGFGWTAEDLNRQLSPSLSADSTISASIPLSALANSGSYNIVVFFSWDKKSHYTSMVSVGPVRMAGLLGQDRFARFLSRGSQLVKDLTLPIVLAILGYYFQLLQGIRDAKRRRQDRKIEAQRQREQEKREESQQVRQNILPLVMSLAERHYMPIVRASRLLIIDYQTFLSTPTASLDKVFFDALFLLKRMDYLRRDKGQIFFQDGRAEAIASDAWLILREKMLSTLGDMQVGLALEKIGNEDGFADFARRRYSVLLSGAFNRLEHWIKSEPEEFMRYLRLVDLLQAVFRFEANRPFAEHWYGTKKGLSFELELSNFDFSKSVISKAAQARVEALAKGWPSYLADAEF